MYGNDKNLPKLSQNLVWVHIPNFVLSDEAQAGVVTAVVAFNLQVPNMLNKIIVVDPRQSLCEWLSEIPELSDRSLAWNYKRLSSVWKPSIEHILAGIKVTKNQDSYIGQFEVRWSINADILLGREYAVQLIQESRVNERKNPEPSTSRKKAKKTNDNAGWGNWQASPTENDESWWTQSQVPGAHGADLALGLILTFGLTLCITRN